MVERTKPSEIVLNDANSVSVGDQQWIRWKPLERFVRKKKNFFRFFFFP
jgi:hypothetical protein